MKKLLYLSMFLWLVLTGCTQEKKEFTVLQWNIWQEGTMVPGGYEAAHWAISSGVPATTRLPPIFPPSGPRSMT